VDSMEAAGRALTEAVGLWLVSPTLGTELLVRASCDALVAGLDTPTLRELAGEPLDASSFELQELVDRTFSELDIALPSRADAEVWAARCMARMMLQGDFDERRLTQWAHRVIGHDGQRELQALVELDDALDDAEVSGRQELLNSVLVEIRSEAAFLMAAQARRA
jgi:hypothetical protein